MARDLIGTAKTSIHSREMSAGQIAPPPDSAQKKLPHSRKGAAAERNGNSDTLDDVSFLRLPEVKAVTGLSKTSLYTLIREGRFPSPVRLGPRAVAWVRSEIKQWAAERVHASRSAA